MSHPMSDQPTYDMTPAEAADILGAELEWKLWQLGSPIRKAARVVLDHARATAERPGEATGDTPRGRVAAMHGERVDDVLGLIGDELGRAVSRFGSFNSAHEGYAVILEELDELWDEIKNDKAAGSRSRQRKEAVQVAAMAARFLLDLPGDPAGGIR